ncbi:hypothetical protein NQ318_001879 [Aromia moschata]|uniref:RING-type domain-containing protein n=1 Tax=Aromia moschata TaxID=1265417 RepID=A0AAV8Z1E9_9CUCU|nr:hypothetical protein NQ318_001879 [Aromia moschata]
MGEGYELTEQILETLCCSVCGYYLSVPPISIISEDGTKYKCGRCHSIKTHIETKVIMYENLAKHMVFPCIYKNCAAKLSWSEVKEHESNCPHRTMVCPRLHCEEEFLVTDFTSHFKEKHKESLYMDKFVLENAHNYYSLDVLVKDDRTYVVIFDYDDTRSGISVCALEPDNRQYELTITSEKSRYSMVCTEQSIVPFDKRVHCFKCVTGVCKNEAHIYRYYKKGILKRMTTRIDRDSVKRIFLGATINYEINIVDVKTEADEDLEDLIVKDMIIDEVNDEEEEEMEVTKEEEIIRRMLECPNCFEYMQPPIYQCVTGHTTCKKCKETLTKCPTCEAAIENIRNLALEDAASSLRLSSLIAEKATGQLDNSDNAPSKEIICPRINCTDSYDLRTIAAHFKDKHANNFHWNSVRIKNVHSYFNIDVVVRYGKAYVVIFDYTDNSFGISVCSVDEHDEDLYEAKLTSENGKFSIVASDQAIVPFNELEHCSKCLSGTCQYNRHKYRMKRNLLFKAMTTKFNKDSVNRMFNFSLLNYVVNIVDGRKAFTKDFRLKKDKIFKRMYECPICHEYMSPPIQQCFTGHSFCKPCTLTKQKCPLCDAKIESTRNYIVEEMSEKIELPCKTDPEKCQYRGSIKRMVEHGEECSVAKKKAKIEEEQEIERRHKEDMEDISEDESKDENIEDLEDVSKDDSAENDVLDEVEREVEQIAENLVEENLVEKGDEEVKKVDTENDDGVEGDGVKEDGVGVA